MALDVRRSSPNENEFFKPNYGDDEYTGLFENNEPKSSVSFFPSLMSETLKNETRALVAEIEQPLTGEGGEGFRSLFEDGWGERKSGEKSGRSPSPGLLDFGLNDSDGGEDEFHSLVGGGGGGGNQSGGEDNNYDSEIDDMEIGTVVQSHHMERFVHIASQNFEIDVGLQVIVKRSTGEWSHAEVCAYDAWPPGGGAMTLQVGDGLRKTLNLGKERHMSIVRVQRNANRSDSKENRGLRGPINRVSVSPSVLPRKQQQAPSSPKEDRISVDFSLSDNLPINQQRGESDGEQGEDEEGGESGNSDYYITNKVSNDSVSSPKRSRNQIPDQKSSPLPSSSLNYHQQVQRSQLQQSRQEAQQAQNSHVKNDTIKNAPRMLSSSSLEDDHHGEKEEKIDNNSASDAAMIPLIRRADGDKCTEDIAKKEFRSLTSGESVSKGGRLLVQRSDGAWSFATVDKVDAWPPEGGTVTVRLGKTTRKALDLSKPHHCRRLRVPRQNHRDNVKGPRLMINNATAFPFERADFGACKVLDGHAMNCVPRHAHVALENGAALKGKIAIVTRGVCPFAEKTKRLMECGVVGIVFVNSSDDLTVPTDPDHLCDDVSVPIILVAHSVASQLVNNTHLYQLPDASDASKQRCSKLISAAASTSIDTASLTSLCVGMTLSDWISMTSSLETTGAAAGGTMDPSKAIPLPQSNILHILCTNKAVDLPLVEAFQLAVKTCKDDRTSNSEARPDVLCALASAKNAEGILPLHLLCANSRACAKGATLIGAVAAFYPPSFHFKDSAGATPFSLLAKLGHLDPVNLANLLERFPIISSKITTPVVPDSSVINTTHKEVEVGVSSEVSTNGEEVVDGSSVVEGGEEDSGLATEVGTLKKQLAELMRHTQEMESEVHTLRAEVSSKDSVLAELSPKKEITISKQHISQKQHQQHLIQEKVDYKQENEDEEEEDDDDEENTEEVEGLEALGRESGEYEMLHNFSAPPSPEVVMSETVRREVEMQVKQMAEEMALKYRRKEEELKEHEKQLEMAMEARDQRIAMMERQVDTLAAQCDVDKTEVLNGELLAWLKASGLEDFALIFAALGVDSLDDILDPSLVGDDELVLAGMDEIDATKFHSSRFRTAKKRREEKLKEEADAKNKKFLMDTSAVVEAAPLLNDNIVQVVIQEEEEEEEDEDDDHINEDNQGENNLGDDKRRKNSGNDEHIQDRYNETDVYNGGDVSFHHDYDYESLDDSRNETALEDVSMNEFLSQLFLPSEAQTYTAILSSLGIDAPKELASVTQDMLVAAGIKKFHARKIGSAEIYRAFL